MQKKAQSRNHQPYQPDFILVPIHTGNQKMGSSFLPVILFARSIILLLDIPSATVYIACMALNDFNFEYVESVFSISAPVINLKKTLSEITSLNELFVLSDSCNFPYRKSKVPTICHNTDSTKRRHNG